MGPELLEQGIDGLDAVDLDALSESELHVLAVATQRLDDRLRAVSAAIVARWDSLGVWAGDGSRTAGARLARESSSAMAKSCGNEGPSQSEAERR